MIVQVSKSALDPPVIPAGKRQSSGEPIAFQFTSDWNGMTKYITFYTPNGQAIEVPYLGGEISIPPEIMQHGGITRFNVIGVAIDGETGTVEQRLKVTGTISVTYNIGENPRLWGKPTPTTLELFLYQAQLLMQAVLQQAKDSGEFNGDPGDPAGFADPVCSTVTLDPQSDASVTVTASGPDTEKVFSFTFQIPRGDSGVYVSETTADTPHGQNLWIVTDGGDTVIDIPDGMVQDGGLVYLTCEGERVGSGASVVGKNFTVLAYYDTLADLEVSVPNPQPGDAYGVGTEAPRDIYCFDGRTHTWVNYGALGSNPTIDSAMSSDSANAVENRVIKEYVDNLIGDVDTAIAAINAIVGGDAS